MARKRARTEDGQFVPDDPDTEQNEAWVEVPEVEAPKVNPSYRAKQARAPKNDAPKEFTFFVSSEPENASFDLRVGDHLIRGRWDAERAFVHWRVPLEHAEALMKHHHVWSGRIIPTEDK